MEQHQSPEEQEKIISQQIVSDLREARKEVSNYDKGRFAWGIRQALFGTEPKTSASTEATSRVSQVPQDGSSEASK